MNTHEQMKNTIKIHTAFMPVTIEEQCSIFQKQLQDKKERQETKRKGDEEDGERTAGKREGDGEIEKEARKGKIKNNHNK